MFNISGQNVNFVPGGPKKLAHFLSNVFALLLDDALLKICPITEVVLFSIITFKTLAFHMVV